MRTIGHAVRTSERAGFRSRRVLHLALLLIVTACSAQAPAPSAAVLDAGKVSSIVVGRSSRADVFGALGQPSRTERSGRGEAWIYETGPSGARGSGRLGGIAAASGVVGAFVPYVGLVGPSLGLAGAAMDGRRPEPETTLAVAFGEDGIVRDCTLSSTAMPAGLPGAAADAPKVADCRRPASGASPASAIAPRAASGG